MQQQNKQPQKISTWYRKNGGTIKWWKSRNKTFLINQLEKLNVRLTKEQIKGGKDKDGKQIKNMANDEVSDMIMKILKITEWWIDWNDNSRIKHLSNNILGISGSSQKKCNESLQKFIEEVLGCFDCTFKSKCCDYFKCINL